MAFLFILWDLDDDPDGNVQHCLEHDLSKEEVDEVLQHPEDTDLTRETRQPIAFGETSTGRYIAVIYKVIDPDTARPVTAFDVPPPRNRP